MTQAQIEQDEEVRAIVAIAQRMASRMNSSFVVDPAKLERFASAKAAEKEAEELVSSTTE